ncbi:MAG: hypothetical protein WC788_09450 [Candidatus Paceibacterota bacterium]|jgi:hypothetical protein
MDNQITGYQPKETISAKRLWFAYFAIFLFFNFFVVLSEKYPNLLGYIIGVSVSKKNISSDGSFKGFVELESGTYDATFYILLALSVIFLLIILKISAQAKTDQTKDGSGSIRLQLTYLIGSLGLLLFMFHGEFIKFMLFSVLALIGILKTIPKNKISNTQ